MNTVTEHAKEKEISMTPMEARTEFAALEKSIGIQAQILISFAHDRYSALNAGIYPTGLCTIGRELNFSVMGNDWPELLANARAKWEEHKDRHRSQVVRKMALEIIRITADIGECTDAALRGCFSSADISQYGADACVDADSIAGRGPFTINRKRGANAQDDQAAA